LLPATEVDESVVSFLSLSQNIVREQAGQRRGLFSGELWKT
jgi:hypothetical protein